MRDRNIFTGEGRFIIKTPDGTEHPLDAILGLEAEHIPEPEFEPIVIPTPSSLEATFTLTKGAKFRKLYEELWREEYRRHLRRQLAYEWRWVFPKIKTFQQIER